MNTVIQRKIEVTPDYQPISSERLIGTFEISCLPTNADDVFFLGDDGSDVPWCSGEWHLLPRIDLSSVQIKGTIGDAITVIGGTY
jgi:hypothetical protein